MLRSSWRSSEASLLTVLQDTARGIVGPAAMELLNSRAYLVPPAAVNPIRLVGRNKTAADITRKYIDHMDGDAVMYK